MFFKDAMGHDERRALEKKKNKLKKNNETHIIHSRHLRASYHETTPVSNVYIYIIYLSIYMCMYFCQRRDGTRRIDVPVRSRNNS